MNTRTYQFYQVDVFSDVPLLGNALAVVVDADDMTDEEMLRFARWTNLSETTFLLKPQDPQADYRVRIFTPDGELPFAGHPTLGTCYVWRETQQFNDKRDIIQECGVGLITLRQSEQGTAFAAPPMINERDLTEDECNTVASAYGIPRSAVLQAKYIDNGPAWTGVEVDSVARLLAITPDYAVLSQSGNNALYKIGVCARYPAGSEATLAVRAFINRRGAEDPVTGSLNAALAQWLIGNGTLPPHYLARQGESVKRDGWLSVRQDADGIWVGGAVTDCIRGQVSLP
ncbi:TPA: PhzF family phenazine biosynthesis protein [Morganella morganii]|uniref:PhzF family phenazine biosynthesis protein n=1 Tax=Morganella morganii TaxID=582 RepID=UPI001A23B636|nr:PhzF family phenazine biosynthesis protein [Morganella morganii]MCU6236035.1 PhzF family phenazine biosynthesis protein [Morganella morganii]HAT1526178.1 PhzF family phenazine biosynthesis protein [Morganella morganii]HDF2364555.1 PhzF family phenazine biosynthesis protein [Morganella morganii]HDF2423177.1 PhzF family phenazine biosynthesis protein [Morganella morganii]